MATGLESKSRVTSLTSKGFAKNWLTLIVFINYILN